MRATSKATSKQINKKSNYYQTFTNTIFQKFRIGSDLKKY